MGGTLLCFSNVLVLKNVLDIRGITILSKSCLKVPRKFVGTPSMFQKLSAMENFMDQRGGPLFFLRKFFVSQCRKTTCGNHLFPKTSGAKKTNMDKNGVSLSVVGNFLSHIAKNKRGGTIQCFRKFLVCKNFMSNEGGGMNFHNFTLEVFFVSLCRKCSWGNPSVFPKIGVLKNFMHNMGLHKLLTKFFRPTLPKNLVGNSSVFQKVSGREKHSWIGGGGGVKSRLCIESFQSHCTEKLPEGTLLCLRKILVRKKTLDKRGGGEMWDITFFHLSFFVSHR